MQGCMDAKSMKGTTLINMMIAVSIVSLLSLIAIPSFTSNKKYQLDQATQEIAFAIRFARTEAMRTGSAYGIDIDRTSKQFTVYKANLATNPVGQEFIAYHPINKNQYDYNIASDYNLLNIEFDNTSDPFLYTDSVRRKSLLFDANGIPIWIDTGSGNTFQLDVASIDLSCDTHTQSVIVQPYTGRVLVQ